MTAFASTAGFFTWAGCTAGASALAVGIVGILSWRRYQGECAGQMLSGLRLQLEHQAHRLESSSDSPSCGLRHATHLRETLAGRTPVQRRVESEQEPQGRNRRLLCASAGQVTCAGDGEVGGRSWRWRRNIRSMSSAVQKRKRFLFCHPYSGRRNGTCRSTSQTSPAYTARNHASHVSRG